MAAFRVCVCSGGWVLLVVLQYQHTGPLLSSKQLTCRRTVVGYTLLSSSGIVIVPVPVRQTNRACLNNIQVQPLSTIGELPADVKLVSHMQT